MSRALYPVQTALYRFVAEGSPQSAAAMSFYAVISIPPLLVVITAILSMAFSGPEAAAELMKQVTTLFGESTAASIAEILARRSQAPNETAALTGSFVLLLGASGFFSQMQASLNQVWGVEAKPSVAWRMLLVKRMISMTAVLGTGFLLLVSLVLTALLAAASDWLRARLGWSPATAGVTEAAVAMITLTLLFAFIFRVLPDVRVPWKSVWRGAIITSLLFFVGKYALGWYLGHTNFEADYGSAGALVLILFWVYYTSLIMLFGAQLTHAQTVASGEPIVPEPYAERVRVVRETDVLAAARRPASALALLGPNPTRRRRGLRS